MGTGVGGVVDSPVRRRQNVRENRTGDCCRRVLCQRPAAAGQAVLPVHTRFVASHPVDSSSGPKNTAGFPNLCQFRALVSIRKLETAGSTIFSTNHDSRKRTRIMLYFSHGLIRLLPGKDVIVTPMFYGLIIICTVGCRNWYYNVVNFTVVPLQYRSPFLSLSRDCRTVFVKRVLLHNGGSWNACTIKRSITLLWIPKQTMWQNGVVPWLLLILHSCFNYFV